jgi:hypothetical protein
MAKVAAISLLCEEYSSPAQCANDTNCMVNVDPDTDEVYVTTVELGLMILPI